VEAATRLATAVARRAASNATITALTVMAPVGAVLG